MFLVFHPGRCSKYINISTKNKMLWKTIIYTIKLLYKFNDFGIWKRCDVSFYHNDLSKRNELKCQNKLLSCSSQITTNSIDNFYYSKKAPFWIVMIIMLMLTLTTMITNNYINTSICKWIYTFCWILSSTWKKNEFSFNNLYYNIICVLWLILIVLRKYTGDYFSFCNLHTYLLYLQLNQFSQSRTR